MWLIRAMYLMGVPPARLKTNVLRHPIAIGNRYWTDFSRADNNDSSEVSRGESREALYNHLLPLLHARQEPAQEQRHRIRRNRRTDDDELRAKMIEMSGGRRTVPEIFIKRQDCRRLRRIEGAQTTPESSTVCWPEISTSLSLRHLELRNTTQTSVLSSDRELLCTPRFLLDGFSNWMERNRRNINGHIAEENFRNAPAFSQAL